MQKMSGSLQGNKRYVAKVGFAYKHTERKSKFIYKGSTKCLKTK